MGSFTGVSVTSPVCHKSTLRRFLAVTLPLALTELLWVLGDVAYVVVYGRMGTDSLAAMAMTFPVQSLAIGLLAGVASSAGVLVGQRLGRDDLGDASLRGSQLIIGGVVAALGIGVLLAAGSLMYVGLFATSGHVRHLGQLCLLVFGLPVWAVFLLLSLEEVVRLAFGWRRLRSGLWLRNLTVAAQEPDAQSRLSNQAAQTSRAS